MADWKTEKILNEWGLSCLINIFKDEGVDFEALNDLTPGSPFVTQLLKNELLGTQIKFDSRLSKYLVNRSEIEVVEQTNEAVNSNATAAMPVLTMSRILDNESQSSVNEVEIDETIAKTPEANMPSFDEEISVSSNTEMLNNANTFTKEQFFNSLEDLDVYNILFDTFKGRIVLSVYDKKGYLTEKDQSVVVDVIVSQLLCYCDPFGQPFALKNHHYKALGKLICTVFPSEDLSIYYVDPKVEGSGQKISKGKIPDAYRNKLRILRNAGIIPRKRKRVDPHSDSDDDSDKYGDCKTAIEYLRFNTSPWNTIEKHWDRSFSFREKMRLKDGGTVNKFFEEFPIIKHPDGYTLLERDYKAMFKDGENKFYEGWPNFSKNLYKIMQTDLKDESSKVIFDSLKHSSVEPDVRDLTLLTLMSALCPPTCRIIGANKAVWKPSIAESSRGFILHVKDIQDLENERNARQNAMYARRLPLQPYVIIVGQNLSTLSDFYINVDKVLFKVESPFKAVDICYKIFHVLNANYPPESEQVWLLLQHNLYEHETETDKKIKGVLRLKRKFKATA